MITPICVKCRKRLTTFTTRLEPYDSIVDGRVVNWTAPNAYCPHCDSMLWFDEFDAIYVAEFEKAAKENNK